MPSLRSMLYNRLYPTLVGMPMSDVAAMARGGMGANPFYAQQIQQTFPAPQQQDKRMHALTSYLLSQRYGRVPAYLMGLVDEAVNLPSSGPTAAYEDLVANMVGLQTPSAPENPFTPAPDVEYAYTAPDYDVSSLPW